MKFWVLLIAWNADANYTTIYDRHETLSACRAEARVNVRMTERWYPIKWKCELRSAD